MTEQSKSVSAAPQEWDGRSPINGEKIDRITEDNGRWFARTPSATYEVFLRSRMPYVVVEIGRLTT
jgi:hypothetical protein